MRLKRLYDWEAPKKEWSTREDGTKIPPVSGVEVKHAGPEQHFSPGIIDRGLTEGWMSIANGQLTIAGKNRTLVYDIKRAPGTYNGEHINYYDCVLREET